MERIEDRLERLGIVGYIINRNGPRFYIERVRNRVQLIDSTRTSQRAYICLENYTAHCTTNSDTHTRAWCMERNKDIENRLAPIARYLRIIGFRIEGSKPIYSHQRWVFRRLHEAGVICHIERNRIILDHRELVRHSEIPVMPITIKPMMALECEHEWHRPMGSQTQVEASYGMTQGLRLRIQDAGRMTVPLAEETIRQLHPVIGEVTTLITIP